MSIEESIFTNQVLEDSTSKTNKLDRKSDSPKNGLSCKELPELNPKYTILLSNKNYKAAKLNRGTGAGGANTNKNGVSYEELTELNQKYTIILSDKNYKIIKFIDSEQEFKATKQTGLFKCMNDKINNKIEKAHGCKNPDECFIDETNKRLFIIEKKFQQVNGSVCEKIQTPDFKLWQYNRTFPEYKIIYVYCLSDWFKKNCKAELEYLKYKKIPVFWGSDIKYKDNIIKFILDYQDNNIVV